MSMEKALAAFNKAEPERTPIGYWEDGDNVIFNTKPIYGPGCMETCQFMVLPDGTVYGTNPAQCHVIVTQPMKKIV